MAKYINKFKNQGEYESQIFNLDYPNINYIESGDTVVWQRIIPRYKVFYELKDGKKNGAIWDSANTEVTQADVKGNSGSQFAKISFDSGVTKIGDSVLGDFDGTIEGTAQSVTEIGAYNNVNPEYFSKFPTMQVLGEQALHCSFNEIPNTVTTIGKNSCGLSVTDAFEYGSGITIPSNITTISGDSIASNEISFNSIIFESETPPSISDYGCLNHRGWASCIYVPSGSVETYKESWSDVASRIFSVNDKPSGYKYRITDDNNDVVFELSKEKEIDGYNDPKSCSLSDSIYGYIPNKYYNELQIGEGVEEITTSFIYDSSNWLFGFQNYHFNKLVLPSSAKDIFTNDARHRTMYYKEVSVPSGVSTFNCTDNTELERVVLEDGLSSLAYFDFTNCTSLTSVTIPNSVTSVDNTTLKNTPWWRAYSTDVSNIYGNILYVNDIAVTATSTTVTSVTFKNTTKYIDYTAFQNCTSLTSVTIPNSVTSISDLAFQNCTSLASVIVLATTPPTLGYAAFADTNNCPIYVPSASVDAYKAATNWSTYASRIQAIPNE